ncbi:hypothetical protein NOC27_380 [Nitrosococcus oceani AFC27]|nr:hypothetical protein NOC27_380 [Nitrosococcus oceani AFC27]
MANIRLSRQMYMIWVLSGQKCLKKPAISIYQADWLDNQ